MQAVGNPAAPMLIALAADGIGATQEGPAHTAVNEVVPGRGIQRDERGTGLGHGCVRWVGCYLNVASQEGLSSKWVSFYFYIYFYLHPNTPAAGISAGRWVLLQ